jgi:tetratricopeptide (TPR) repeat protein
VNKNFIRAIGSRFAMCLLLFFGGFVPGNLPAQNRKLSPAQADEISRMLVQADQLRGQDELDGAASLLEQVRQKLDGYFDPRLQSNTLNRLAMLKSGQGRLQEAEGLARTVLSLVAGSYGTNSADYAVAAANLAAVLIKEASYVEAARLMQTALTVGREKLELGHRLADVLATSAELLFELGHSRQAIQTLHEEAKVRGGQPGGAEALAHTYTNLAVAYKEVGKYSRALDAIHKAEHLWTGSSPESSTLKLRGQSTLLVLYEVTHQYHKADLLVPLVLREAEVCFTKRPQELASILNNIGTIYMHRSRNQEAAAMFNRAYQIDLDVLGPSHPRTAYVQMNYGEALIKLGQTEEGRSLRTQARAFLNVLH